MPKVAPCFKPYKSLSLALQISVIYQMFLRLFLESHSRMSSAQCILLYGEKLPTESIERDGEKTPVPVGKTEAPAISLKNVTMRYRPGLPQVLKGYYAMTQI